MTHTHKKSGACAALAACLLLSGCSSLPSPREMGNMALLRTMGVDRREQGVAVTLSTGLRARGLQGEQEEALVLAAEGASLSAACLAAQGGSDGYVFFGYVDQLLLGEELAWSGFTAVLDYAARDNELGLGARLWVVRGDTAGAAVRSGGKQGVDSRLDTLRMDGELGAALQARRAGEVYTDLLEWGSVYVPALSLEGEGPLEERGYAVLERDGLAGFLDGEAARGLELLTGGAKLDVIEAGDRTLRVTGAETSARLVWDGPVPAELALTCRVTAQVAEYSSAPGREELAGLGAMLEKREADRLRLALKQLQDWKTDCAGLGPRGGLSSPGRWAAVREGWPDLFSRLPVRLRVQVDLRGI